MARRFGFYEPWWLVDIGELPSTRHICNHSVALSQYAIADANKAIDDLKEAGSLICNPGPSKFKVAEQHVVCVQPMQQSLCISLGLSRSGCSLCTVRSAEHSPHSAAHCLWLAALCVAACTSAKSISTKCLAFGLQALVYTRILEGALLSTQSFCRLR